MSEPSDSHPSSDEPSEPPDRPDPLQRQLTAWDEKLRRELAGSPDDTTPTGDPNLDSLRR